MPDPAPSGGASTAMPAATSKKRSRKPLLLAALLVPLAAGGAAAWMFRAQLMPAPAQKPAPTAAAAAAPATPVFVDLDEMTVTIPNGGHPRQLRIRIVLELTRPTSKTQPADLITPRVYDALLTYLRTVQSDELEGGLALDRLRGDLYRRLSLLLGTDVLHDVLITGLVLA